MNTPAQAALVPGLSVPLVPGLRRVLAANPSAFTGPGTNTYILGEGRVALIDPGPADAAHLAAVLGALRPGEHVEAIIVTHSHRDHSGLAQDIARRLRAPVLAFGDSAAGRNPALAGLADLGGGEGVDDDFAPDVILADGDSLSGPDWEIRAHHTPGHLGNHLCLQWGDTLFSGDTAMGWSTSIVSPPDGDMTAYMASLDRLTSLAPRMLWPGHGAAVDDGAARIAQLAAHRRQREQQIRLALAERPGSARMLAERIYQDLPAGLLPAAERNVLAHLLDLHARGLAHAAPTPARDAEWHPA